MKTESGVIRVESALGQETGTAQNWDKFEYLLNVLEFFIDLLDKSSKKR